MVNSSVIQRMLLHNNVGKAFLVEDLALPSKKMFGTQKWQNLYRMRDQYGNGQVGYLDDRSNSPCPSQCPECLPMLCRGILP